MVKEYAGTLIHRLLQATRSLSFLDLYLNITPVAADFEILDLFSIQLAM